MKSRININESELNRIIAESVIDALREASYDNGMNADYEGYVVVDDGDDSIVARYGPDEKRDAIFDTDMASRKGGSFSVYGVSGGMFDEDTIVYSTSDDRDAYKF